MLRQTTWKLALSTFTSAVVSDIMAIILVFSLGILAGKAGDWILVIVLLLNVIIYAILLYNKPWEEGFRDPSRVKYKRMKKFMYKGLVAGLIADIPYALIFLLMVITKYANWYGGVFHVLYLFVNMQFNYLITMKVFVNMPWLCVIFLLPMPLITHLAYVLGYKQISIGFKLMYKKTPDR